MTSKNPSDKIAVVAIDEQSIDNIGRWPWSREVHAKFIDQMSAAKRRSSATRSSIPRRRSTPASST